MAIGFDPTAKPDWREGKDPIDVALFNALDRDPDEVDVDDILQLLDDGADINGRLKYGYSPLMLAVGKHYVDVVPALLARGASAAAISDTPFINVLHLAAHRPFFAKLVPELIAAGANINARTSKGSTPLAYAAMRHELATVTAFLKAGADTDLVDNDHRSPLHHAVGDGASDAAELVQALLTAGANVDLQDNNGDTALIRATRRGYYKSAAALVAAGADVFLKANDGRTARDCTEVMLDSNGLAVKKALLELFDAAEPVQAARKKQEHDAHVRRCGDVSATAPIELLPQVRPRKKTGPGL